MLLDFIQMGWIAIRWSARQGLGDLLRKLLRRLGLRGVLPFTPGEEPLLDPRHLERRVRDLPVQLIELAVLE